MNQMFYDIAKKYAAEHNCDIVEPCTERNGYMYFHLDYTGRARYTGHPHIIKISPTGKVHRVLDFDEIYWAFKYALQQRSNRETAVEFGMLDQK